jgi:hypothetical protein
MLIRQSIQDLEFTLALVFAHSAALAHRGVIGFQYFDIGIAK